MFLRGYPEISLTNGGNKSVIYDGTSPLFTLYIKCSFCWCLLTDRLVHPHSLYNLTNDTDLVSPVSIRVQPSQTNDACSMIGNKWYR